MTRRRRIVIPGWVHHVTQRGNHRQTVFFHSEDRNVYLKLVAEYFPRYEIRLIGYALMGNHVHLAVIPEKESSLAEGIGQLHHDFAIWQNIQRGTNGHLWQNRFFSCPVEENRVGQLLRYVELNPVRARIVENPYEWEWSSAQAHLAGRDASGLLDMTHWQRAFHDVKWEKLLARAADDELVCAEIRKITAKGYLLGSDETALRLEREMGIRLLPRKPGRPPRNAETHKMVKP
jgi:putative transposase